MKKLQLLAATAVLCAIVRPVFGQMPDGGGIAGTGISQIFGEHKAFSASVQLKVEGGMPGTIEVAGTYAFLDGNMRIEADLGSVKGDGIPEEALAQMKMMGMDKGHQILRANKKIAYIIYPGLKSYAEIVIPPNQAVRLGKPAKCEKTELGKETVDNQQCVKNKLVFTFEDGSTQEFTVWNATDLKDFPVQAVTTQRDSTITIKFNDVKLEKPDAALFDPPADYTKYGSIMELMDAAMKRIMPQPPGE